ncbi:type II toxin-antitoxin system VapC family toxin [Leptospira interrogans]|uniref:PilT-like protein n=16 Tax=Leptospira interrogans TaxID=173 RepID=Q8F7E4_LEPIN|nr:MULTISPECIES: type II toxin-antitoxin system VapC family toxin [Leptospira]APH42455.1 Twitching motility protein PilT [Leptospira interrogans serovar Copenhageni/Icterohaemorrhagiae]EMF73294.1 PIN domain protein [Leptospira interrogans serovar Canicola str. LT1962]EMG12464.1 PIN domain protein [Leptospira interrogans serovar Grippotyphosa str. LT2186]EMG19222.1 PIN domain protein [Leptospira interrogans serovar Copenhageni str. LT2050]EMM96980.1 PIN domain protein [Leptospira interrogans se
MYLLDTNICIFLIKKKNATLLENLKKKLNKDLFVSSLTVAELEFGIQKSEFKEKNKVALIEFLTIFNILSFSDKDAESYGIIRADLERKGNVIGSIDMLLAAQAIANNYIFVTNNTKEFKRIKALKIENWTQ